MSVLCPPAQLLTHSHCSRYLPHCYLRSLPNSPGSCSGSRPLTRKSFYLGFRRSMNGSVAAYPESGAAELSEAPGWSRFRCLPRVPLHLQVLTLLQPAQRDRPVSGPREPSSSCCCHLGLRSSVWNWEPERGLSWRQMQPSLWDRCQRRRSCCWWDWLMLWMPAQNGEKKKQSHHNYPSAKHTQ